MPDPLDPPPPGGTDPLDPPDAAASAAEALADTVTIQRKTPASDGAGSHTLTWADLATDVPFALTKTKRWMEGVTGGELRAVMILEGQFPVGTDLLPKDRILHGDWVYEVTDTDACLTEAAILTAQLVRIRR
jgi:hypothetical protein